MIDLSIDVYTKIVFDAMRKSNWIGSECAMRSFWRGTKQRSKCALSNYLSQICECIGCQVDVNFLYTYMQLTMLHIAYDSNAAGRAGCVWFSHPPWWFCKVQNQHQEYFHNSDGENYSKRNYTHSSAGSRILIHRKLMWDNCRAMHRDSTLCFWLVVSSC